MDLLRIGLNHQCDLWTYDSKVWDLQLKSHGLTTQKSWTYGKRIRDAAFFLIIMLFTFAATLLKSQNYVSSRTIRKCVEHVSTSTEP